MINVHRALFTLEQLLTTAVPLTLCHTVSVLPVTQMAAIMADSKCNIYKGFPRVPIVQIVQTAIHILTLHVMPLDPSPPQVVIMCAVCVRPLLSFQLLPAKKNAQALSSLVQAFIYVSLTEH